MLNLDVESAANLKYVQTWSCCSLSLGHAALPKICADRECQSRGATCASTSDSTRLDPILGTNRSPSPSQDGEGSDGEGFGAWRHKRQEARRQPLHYPKARPASALEVRCQSLAFLRLLDSRYSLFGWCGLLREDVEHGMVD